MDIQKLQRGREKEGNTEASTERSKEEKERATAPPSSTSSPSHEFSFTISLHPCSNSTPTTIKCNKAPSSFEIDLAPADDIFFHGHLLPLHLLSHPTISPRPSDISIEDLGFPHKQNYDEQSPTFDINHDHHDADTSETKERSKPKSFSSLFGFKKGHKGSEVGEKEEENKKKKRFDVSRLWKKYASMVEHLLFSKGKTEKRDLRRRPYSYSYSGNLNPRERDRCKRRGEFSLPASMRTSPTNSGLLLATPMTSSSSAESTMEELQNAIQAAITHCKNSVALKEDKCKC